MAGMKRREFVATTGKAALGLGVAAPWLAPQIAQAAGPGARIKIGQLGTGHAHASGKFATLLKLKADYEFVGSCEPDPELRRAAEKQSAYRSVPWLTEEQLLNTPGLRAVAVETRVRELVPAALRCLAAGMHVHLDKPAGESLGEFKRLLDEAARKKLVVQLGYMLRYNPGFRFCKRAVGEGWLGEVFELHGVMSKTSDVPSRKTLAEYRGGAMFELGCHLIDAMVWMLGRPDKVASYARQLRPQQDTLQDSMFAVFEYPKAIATIRVALAEVEGERRRQFVVCGDKGTVDIRPLEPPELRLALSGPRLEFKKGYQQVPLPPLTGRYDGDFLDLAKIIRGEKAPDFTPAHDLAVHEAILRASGVAVG